MSLYLGCLDLNSSSEISSSGCTIFDVAPAVAIVDEAGLEITAEADTVVAPLEVGG
jgi:hypothetical protein